MLERPPSARTERRAALLALGVGVVLLIVKFGAYLLTSSAVILSDALESIVNVLAGGFALYAIILAHQPADREHPYGHGKIEFLSAGFEGGMVIIAAITIVARAVEKLIHPEPVLRLEAGLLLIIIATLINGAVGLFLVRQGKHGGSITLEADGKHLLSDAITSVVVLLALVLMKLAPSHTWIDPAAAIGVAGYITWMGIGLIRRSAAGLMDEQDRDDDVVIRRILDSHLPPSSVEPVICSYHKLRHRHSGRYHWVDFHIVVPAEWNVERGHHVASAIEHEIEAALGEGNATAHIEPCIADSCRECREHSSP